MLPSAFPVSIATFNRDVHEKDQLLRAFTGPISVYINSI